MLLFLIEILDLCKFACANPPLNLAELKRANRDTFSNQKPSDQGGNFTKIVLVKL